MPRSPDEDKICYTCKFWNAFGPAYWVNPNEAGNHQCRRYPPHFNASGEAVWPETAHDDWCGEWVDDEEQKEQEDKG